MLVNLMIAAVSRVAITPESYSTTATAFKFSRNLTLRNVFRELYIDLLSNFTHHKRLLISLVCKYIDVLAESDSDIKTTSFTFYNIDTVDTRLLPQPVR